MSLGLIIAMSLPGYGQSGTVGEDFDIPAQALSTALLNFGAQANLSLMVREKDTDDKISKTLVGHMSPHEALTRLLAGSRLGFEYIDRKTIVISRDLYQPQNNGKITRKNKTVTRPPDNNNAPRATIDEVVVTALRRRSNMQKVPVAVSVLNPTLIREDRIYNLQDVGTRVPGLTVENFSLGQPTIHVRGIGSNDDGAALDNSIVMFIDDVYVGRITAINLNYFDLERIEIIRGPQGTLYGKNAIGGAINITSNPPTDHLVGVAEVTLGNYNRIDTRAILSGPLVADKILGRLAFQSRKRDGWQRSLFLPGVKQNNQNTWSGRGKLRFILSERLQIELDGDYNRDNLGSTGRIPVASRVPVRLLGPDGLPNGKTALPTTIFKNLGGSARLAINSDRGFTHRTIWGLSSRISREGNYGRLLSITAYRKTKFDWLEDSTGLPSSLTDQKVDSHVRERHSQFSQEFRWISPGNTRLTYVMGLYYLFEHTHRIESFIFPKGKATTDQDNRTNSFAAFGQATYGLSAQLKFTVGGRLTYEHKKLDQQNILNGDQFILLENFTMTNEGDWTDFSPDFILSWQQTESIMWYASISRGYKSGGFQGSPATRELARRTIGPETVWNYEIGYKSQWLNNRFRLNLVGFYSDYRDLQVVQFKTEGNFGVFQTSNAASAKLRGVEIEFALKPSSGLEFFGSYAYLRATYNKFHDLAGRDFTGNTLRQAPRNSLYLALRYEHPFRDGRFRFRLDYRYQGKSFREPDNSITIQPAFDLVDSSIAYTSADNHWEATLWAKNLLDREYITHLYVLGGNDYALFGTPRTYGLTMTFNF
ncbi:MAG: TonB-dependent receptor [Alphaproteobacteria bacterium]|nr:TonB-dependent receptor [Alphaproteobacteria bacterium]